jgi:hypothetical protein
MGKIFTSESKAKQQVVQYVTLLREGEKVNVTPTGNNPPFTPS